MDLFNQLPELRRRLVGAYQELSIADLWAVLGEIAVLCELVERAERFAAQMREERTMSKLRALQEYAAERRLLTVRVETGEYIPPPASAPRRRQIPART